MHQYNGRRRPGTRPNAQKIRKRQQRKKVAIIAFASAILLAVFAVLSAFGIIDVRSLFGKDGDFKPPIQTSGDTEKFPDTPEATDTDSEAPDTTETEKVPPQTTEPVTEPPETEPITEPVTSEPDTTDTDADPFETTEDLPSDTETDDTTDEDSSSDSTEDTSPDSTDDPTGSSDDSSSDTSWSDPFDSSSDSTDESSDESSESDSESGDEELLTPPENRFEWPCVLKETEPADDDYFADTLFIGDSRMQGVEFACSKDSKATFFTAVSVRASQIATREGVKMLVNGVVKNVSIIDAIRISDRQFKRIYMMFGINELGTYGGTPAIIKEYRMAVERIAEIQPEAEICILGVMPVFNSKGYVSGYTGYEANPRILELNIALIEMANEMKLHYLDIYHLFVTDDGQLKPDVSKDGIHLLGVYSKELMEYVKTHAIIN